MEEMKRRWFSQEQKAEFWERWKAAHSPIDIARALERRNKISRSRVWGPAVGHDRPVGFPANLAGCQISHAASITTQRNTVDAILIPPLVLSRRVS